jgi:hypothetical protein
LWKSFYEKYSEDTKKGTPLTLECLFRDYRILKGSYIRGCRALLALLDIEYYALVFVQNLEAFTLNSAVMNKHIATFIALDEAESLTLVKPLYCTFWHCGNPPFVIFLKLDYLNAGKNMKS